MNIEKRYIREEVYNFTISLPAFIISMLFCCFIRHQMKICKAASASMQECFGLTLKAMCLKAAGRFRLMKGTIEGVCRNSWPACCCNILQWRECSQLHAVFPSS